MSDEIKLKNDAINKLANKLANMASENKDKIENKIENTHKYFIRYRPKMGGEAV